MADGLPFIASQINERFRLIDQGMTNDSNDETARTTAHCTAALPGQVFQEIYVCRACCCNSTDGQDDQATNLACLCQACAETCHASCKTADDEDAVDYIGVGPASCDCHTLTTTAKHNSCACQLYQASCAFAQQQNLLLQKWDASCTLPRSNHNPGGDEFLPIQVFDIPALQQSTSIAQRIMEQAQLLVHHSKDTFWVDAPESNVDDDTIDASRCLLEGLAYEILLFHSRKDGTSYRGCEWWVQVKPNKASTSDTNNEGSISIDMHYDKDEDLAESFGLGVFPTKSTVTYLTTGATTAAPTLIFPHTYHDPADTLLPHVYASRTVQGKHLVFDGSLLHGAIPLVKDNGVCNDDDVLRVTFLVNLWKDHRPMGIQILPFSIRQALHDATNPDTIDLFSLAMVPRDNTSIPTRTTDSREWMSLPFVQDGMVVETVVLPAFENDADVVLIKYEEGFEARLGYPNDEADDEADDEEEEAGGE